MPYLLYAGLIAEGITDYKFFRPIIEKILIECAFECRGDVDINVIEIKCYKGNSFQDYVFNGRKMGAEEYGLSLLIVHADSDSPTSQNVLENKFSPVFDQIETNTEEEFCQHVIPLIPIHETESWMLADKELFKKVVGTDKSNGELEISGHPESFTDPKAKIENAIRIARSELPKKKQSQLTIAELYSPIGESLQIDKLQTFESFNSFRQDIMNFLRELNLID